VYNRRGRDELKFVDTVTSAAGTAAGAVTLLNGVAQGTDYNQRIGRKFTMKSIMCRFGISYGTGAAVGSVGNIVRILIFYDCQTNLNTPAVTDVLQTASYLSPMNLNNRDRFIVICDKRFVLQSGGPNARFFKKFKFLNTAACYKSGATVGDITDITSGSIYALAYTDGEMGGDNSDPTIGVRMQGLIRLRYEDS